MSNKGLYLVFFCLGSQLIAGTYEERFERIYKEKLWGENDSGEGFSGGGSKLTNVLPYYEYLVSFLHSENIKSVVDLGCGDWEFSRYINWEGIDYKGFDVVSPVIEKNTARYGNTTTHFYSGNFLEMDIPPADLLICKHVLQHMPTEGVLAFLKLLPKFKHCIIVEDMTNYKGYNVHHPLSESFPFWEDRGVDLTKPPFNIPGTKTYFSEPNGNRHLILHIVNAP